MTSHIEQHVGTRHFEKEGELFWGEFNYHLPKHNIVTKDINKTTQGKTEIRLLALSAFMTPSEPRIRSTPVLSGDVFVRSDVMSLGVSVIDECVFGLQFSKNKGIKKCLN